MKKEGLVLVGILIAGIVVSGIIFYGDVFNDEVSLSPALSCLKAEGHVGVTITDINRCYQFVKNDVGNYEEALSKGCGDYLCALNQVAQLNNNPSTLEKQCAREVDSIVSSDLSQICQGLSYKKSMSPLQVFVTHANIEGDSGLAAMDALCQFEAKERDDVEPGFEFKALIATTDRQVGGRDWVIDSFRSYVSIEDKQIFISNSKGGFNNLLVNKITSSSSNAWGGFTPQGKLLDNCDNWDNYKKSVTLLDPDGPNLIVSLTDKCKYEHPVVCVEQPAIHDGTPETQVKFDAFFSELDEEFNKQYTEAIVSDKGYLPPCQEGYEYISCFKTDFSLHETFEYPLYALSDSNNVNLDPENYPSIILERYGYKDQTIIYLCKVPVFVPHLESNGKSLNKLVPGGPFIFSHYVFFDQTNIFSLKPVPYYPDLPNTFSYTPQCENTPRCMAKDWGWREYVFRSKFDKAYKVVLEEFMDSVDAGTASQSEYYRRGIELCIYPNMVIPSRYP